MSLSQISHVINYQCCLYTTIHELHKCEKTLKLKLKTLKSFKKLNENKENICNSWIKTLKLRSQCIVVCTLSINVCQKTLIRWFTAVCADKDQQESCAVAGKPNIRCRCKFDRIVIIIYSGIARRAVLPAIARLSCIVVTLFYHCIVNNHHKSW